MARILLGTWALLATAGALWLGTGRQLRGAQVVDTLAVVAALVMLWLVVRVPWDLYFRARGVVRAQKDGVARGVGVRAEELSESARLARRLLALALGLHLVGAAACAGVSWASGGQLGWVASAAFLLTMGLRPAIAMVAHVRARLDLLQRRARLPTVDAVSLGERLEVAEAALKRLHEAVEDDASGLAALGRQIQGVSEAQQRSLSQQARHHQAELDRLGLEMERALEKMTRDQEVLAGLRAFLQMVKERR